MADLDIAVSSATCEAWLASLHRPPVRVNDTSQGHQDGILRGIFERINSTNRECVEFGFGYAGEINFTNVTIASIARSGNRLLSRLNTQGLIRQGWHPTFFDAELELPLLNVRRAVLTRATIADRFREARIPIGVDYMSVDVDSIDAWLLLGVLTGGYRPRVISVEYNQNFLEDQLVTCEEAWHSWTARSVYGASAATINLIAELHDYQLVTIDRGLDLFFVRRDVLRRARCDPQAMPTFLQLAARLGSLGQRRHATCTAEDAARLVDFPLALLGLSAAAHAQAIRAVGRLNALRAKTNSPLMCEQVQHRGHARR